MDTPWPAVMGTYHRIIFQLVGMKTRKGKACSVSGKCFGTNESIVLVARNIRDLRKAYKTVSFGQMLDESHCWEVEIAGKKQLNQMENTQDLRARSDS